MKNFTLLLFFTFSISLLSAQNKDEEAIKKVIVTEFDAYVQRDFKTWADTYVDAPTTTLMGTDANTSGSLFAMSDFQKISKGMKGMFDSGSKSTISLANRDGWLIRIKGDMAFAIYNEEFFLTNGTKIKAKTQKVMERIKGQWKIASTAVIGDFNNAIIPTPNPEEEVIKAVLIKETSSFWNGDYDGWASCYLHEPHLLCTLTNAGDPGDVVTFKGWEKLSTTVGGWLKNSPPKSAEEKAKEAAVRKTIYDDWNINIRGNVAYASYKQTFKNDEKKTSMDFIETRTLEKIKGEWRIALQSTLVDFKHATPPMRSKY
jgi:ketosteroid isomerase-like protein